MLQSFSFVLNSSYRNSDNTLGAKMTESASPQPAHGHGHSHGVDESNENRILWALIVTGLFLLAEVVGGFVSGSLVLLADAGHMLVDFLALLLAWIGFRIARMPPDEKRSFGYHRFPVLAAYTNGIALFFITVSISYEAVNRLIDPPEEILGGVLMGVAIAGLVANLVCYLLLTAGRSDNINVRSAALHVLGDLLGSVAAIAAAIIIMLTQWKPIDPILSVVVCLLILNSAWKIVSRAGHILMQGTPFGLDINEVQSQVKEAVPEVEDVHHIHVWELAEGKPIISLHARISKDENASEVLDRIKTTLREHFDLKHSVVQLEEHEVSCPD